MLVCQRVSGRHKFQPAMCRSFLAWLICIVKMFLSMSESSPPKWIQDPFWGTEKGENQDSQVQQDASGIARKVMFWGVKLATDFAFKRGFYEAGGVYDSPKVELYEECCSTSELCWITLDVVDIFEICWNWWTCFATRCNKCQLRFTTVLILTAQLIQFWLQLRRFCMTAGGNRCSPKVVDERRSGTFHSGLSGAGLYSAGGIFSFSASVSSLSRRWNSACQMRWFDYSNSQLPETKVDIGKVGEGSWHAANWRFQVLQPEFIDGFLSFLQRIRARCGDAQAEPLGLRISQFHYVASHWGPPIFLI
jgi:hypothetical protein